VSVYEVQKLLFHVNRDRAIRARFLDERERLVADYGLTEEERRAVLETDFQALYRMGVHSLLLGPLAAALGVSFPDYLAMLRGTGQGAGGASGPAGLSGPPPPGHRPEAVKGSGGGLGGGGASR
jgi:hypothetical protein